MREKKRGVGFWIGLGILCGILLLLLLLGWKILAVSRDAEYLAEHLDITTYRYQMELELDESELEQDAVAELEALVRVGGVDRDEVLSPVIEGNVDGDQVVLMMYPEKGEQACVEAFLSRDLDALNFGSLYQRIRDKIPMGNLLPERKDGAYLTLQQTERLFGTDMKQLISFVPPTEHLQLSKAEYMGILLLMKRSRDGDRVVYSLKQQDFQIRLVLWPEEIGSGKTGTGKIGSEETHPVRLKIQVTDPATLAEQAHDLWKLLKVDMDPQKLAAISKADVTLEFTGEKLQKPQRVMDETTFEVLYGVGDILKNFFMK